MKLRGLLFLFATIFLVASAPVHDAESKDALLQRALDDTENHDDAAVAMSDESPAVAESDAEDLALDVVARLLDFVKSKTSTPSAMQTVFHIGSGPGYRRRTGVWYNNKPRIPRTHLIRALPVDPPQPQPTDFPEILSTDLPRALPVDLPRSVKRKSPSTSNPHPSHEQRFIPRVDRDLLRKPQETGDGSSEVAEIEAFAALLGTALKAFKALKFLKNLAPSSGSKSGSSSRTHVGTSPSRYGNLARRFLGFPEENENGGHNSNTDEPQVEIERILQDTEDEYETAEERVENAEIEKFKFLKKFLGKTLKVLKHKLRPRSRTPENDREAVYRPTKWKDLGRNLLGAIGDRLDPQEETVEEQVTNEAEIEQFRSFLRKAVELLQSKLKSRSTTPDENREVANNRTNWKDLGRNFLQIIRDRLGQTDGRSQGNDDETDIDGDGDESTSGNENTAAEIEGFKSFLSKALGRLDRRLKPTSRSPEEDMEAVRNPMKWRDLGRNLIRALKDKVDRGPNTAPGSEIETEVEGTLVDESLDEGTEEEIAEKEGFWKKVIPKIIKGIKIYKNVKDTIKRG